MRRRPSINRHTLTDYLAKNVGIDNSVELKGFLGGVALSSIGTLVSSGILMITAIVAGRLMGPGEYGKYGLITSVAAILSTVMSFGFSIAVIKYASAEEDVDTRGSIYTYSLLGLLLTIAVFAVPFMYARPYIATLLKADQSIINYACLIAGVMIVRTLFESFLIAEKKFKLFSKVKISESAIVFLCFFGLTRFHPANFLLYYWPLVIGAAMSVAINLYNFRNSFRKIGNISMYKEMFHYQSINIGLILIGVFLSNIDTLFISRYLTKELLGIYSAYLGASLMIFSQISSAVYNVLFASMTTKENKADAVLFIDRFFVKFSFVAIPVIMLVAGLVISIYGGNYGVKFTYLLLAAIYTYFFIWASSYSGVVNSSKKLLFYCARFAVLKPIFLALLFFLLVVSRHLTIEYILLVMTSSFLYDILFTKISLRLYLK